MFKNSIMDWDGTIQDMFVEPSPKHAGRSGNVVVSRDIVEGTETLGPLISWWHKYICPSFGYDSDVSASN